MIRLNSPQKTDSSMTAEARFAGGRELRVMLVTHAYTPPGPRRQSVALGELVKLKVIAPRPWVEEWGPNSGELPKQPEWREYPIVRFINYEYLLLSFTLGVREFRPDVIHVDYPPWSPVFWQCLLVRRLFIRRAKLIAGAKKNTFRQPRGILGWFKNVVSKAGSRRADRIEAASQLAARMLQENVGLSADRISVVTHMGVDIEAFHPETRTSLNGEPLTVGYCGKFSEHKGLRVLLDSVRDVRLTGVDLRLKLLGRGPMGTYLEAIAKTDTWLTVEQHVPQDAVPTFMSTLDIYVLPALICPDHQEHDGHALLQAMSSGVAVIGTQSGIIPELLTPETGVLVPPGDRSALATQIQRLATDEMLRAKYGLSASKRISSQFSLERVARCRLEQYLEVAGN